MRVTSSYSSAVSWLSLAEFRLASSDALRSAMTCSRSRPRVMKCNETQLNPNTLATTKNVMRALLVGFAVRNRLEHEAQHTEKGHDHANETQNGGREVG